ncbi:hypothetical protein O181_107817 [Austropuccinia psidii MF-1]|uniref:Tet-like 2OG-Fe(II) oxygenase domain-containing protein n=1 Tax=Austropuccinia psidii MF-1 TaxID=1389203 RepID=A0A9Q3PPS4_9BASI|nr:hypothetical protein [Austropuccinia psidii MF-1]
MEHYWRDLCSRLGGTNAARRMHNLVCMEVSGKLKTQKMNGGTKVPILAHYEGNIPTNQGVRKFASALTFTMNGIKNSPHLDKNALLYALGWWFQADKRTGQIQRDASKRCTGGKFIFPNENFWIDLSDCHGLIQVVWASSTFAHYTDPAQDNESTALVGMSPQCSRRFPTTHTPILTPVQDPDNSHTNPYPCEGSKNAKNSLCLYRLPTIDMPIYMLVKVANNADNFLRLCRLPTIHLPILTLVKVPHNAAIFLCLCRIPTIHTPILMLVKVPHNAENFLCLCRIPTIHTPILTPVQAPNNSQANPYACAGSQKFTHQSLHL